MKKKRKLTEIIVVEGKDDTRRLNEVLEVDTIETIGSAINEEIIERIKHGQETRGVIIFTDPDYAGEKIRKKIMAAVPDAKHAFLPRTLAAPKNKGNSLGVEHASDQSILEALEKVVTTEKKETTNSYQEVNRKLLLDYGLIAGEGAKKLREKLGDELHIGYTNSKQLQKRLKMFQITEEEVKRTMDRLQKQLLSDN